MSSLVGPGATYEKLYALLTDAVNSPVWAPQALPATLPNGISISAWGGNTAPATITPTGAPRELTFTFVKGQATASVKLLLTVEDDESAIEQQNVVNAFAANFLSDDNSPSFANVTIDQFNSLRHQTSDGFYDALLTGLKTNPNVLASEGFDWSVSALDEIADLLGGTISITALDGVGPGTEAQKQDSNLIVHAFSVLTQMVIDDSRGIGFNSNVRIKVLEETVDPSTVSANAVWEQFKGIDRNKNYQTINELEEDLLLANHLDQPVPLSNLIPPKELTSIYDKNRPERLELVESQGKKFDLAQSSDLKETASFNHVTYYGGKPQQNFDEVELGTDDIEVKIELTIRVNVAANIATMGMSSAIRKMNMPIEVLKKLEKQDSINSSLNAWSSMFAAIEGSGQNMQD
ncbi:unnamed protein product [Didymodactylos carnosus]|uniref:Uncharacterized protein n=1 Tax=Didymodactylos carnosus TaxID=1234261 RepID=A0A8S2CM94_9BILA|nr:unnamed protein product [Didymodactylos carnosus]CAF3525860.1 unnamed protein product [Didymodactylos carnosus]